MKPTVLIMSFATLVSIGSVPVSAHVTPSVTLRKQADVIKSALPGAQRFKVSTIHVSKRQLQQLQQYGYSLHDSSVRFYSGITGSGSSVGEVVFPQVDTVHGPIEVGVALTPDDAVSSVLVTRATIELKPWVVDAERSGALAALIGLHPDDPEVRPSAVHHVTGMVGFVADVIATAVRRALILQRVLQPTLNGTED